MMTATFYSFKCPKCGNWGSKEIRIKITDAKYKCKFCNKTTKIKKRSTLGISMIYKGPFDNPQQVADTTRILNGVRNPQMLEIYENQITNNKK